MLCDWHIHVTTEDFKHAWSGISCCLWAICLLSISLRGVMWSKINIHSHSHPYSVALGLTLELCRRAHCTNKPTVSHVYIPIPVSNLSLSAGRLAASRVSTPQKQNAGMRSLRQSLQVFKAVAPAKQPFIDCTNLPSQAEASSIIAAAAQQRLGLDILSTKLARHNELFGFAQHADITAAASPTAQLPFRQCTRYPLHCDDREFCR